MRKSPLSAKSIKIKPRLSTPQDVIDFALMRPKLVQYNGQETVLDFTLLYKKGCQADGDVLPARKPLIVKLAHHINKQIQDKRAHGSIEQNFVNFKYYLTFCDRNNLDPMTKEGYRSFVGNAGELRRLIELGRKPLPYIFLYEDGQELGIKEATAGQLAGSTKLMLTACGVYRATWHADTRYFCMEVNPTQPYSQNEQRKALRRLQYYFFSLSSQLVAYRKANPGAPPPVSLLAVVDKKDNGKLIEVEVANKRSAEGQSVKSKSPFNRAMQAAYYLFAYYTSFNAAAILDVRLPINILTERKEGRTLKYVTVRGYKGRSHKDVEGLFSDYDPHLMPAADTNNGVGFLAAEVDKKDGLEFIKALSELSALYNNHSNGKLLYQLNERGEQTPIGKQIGNACLADELGLLSDSRTALTDYLVESFAKALDDDKFVSISVPKNFGLGKVVSKKYSAFGLAKIKKVYVVNIAYMAIRCMTDLEIKNIIMPLTYSDINDDGKIIIAFNYVDGRRGQIVVDSKYQAFFESLEAYSLYYNGIKPSKYHPNQALKPAYLLPLGGKHQTYQWDGIELVNSPWFRSLGIQSGDYYLDLTARRFRATTSNNEYSPSDSGHSVSKYILQNTLNTLHDHYSEGLPAQNKLIASQAIQVIEEWAKVREIEKAKTVVKERLNIPVLEYEQWKRLRMPTNPNGVLCKGAADVTSQNGHRESKRYAEKLLDTDYGEIACYQFDLCMTCKSAKLVDDVHATYKLLSFVDLLEDAADRMPERTSQLTEKATYFRQLAEQNLSVHVLEKAKDKLFREGRYFLHNDNVLNTVGSEP